MTEYEKQLQHVYELNVKDAERLVKLFKEQNDTEALERAEQDLKKWQAKLTEWKAKLAERGKA